MSQFPLGKQGPRTLGEQEEKSMVFSSQHGAKTQLENVLVPGSLVPVLHFEQNKHKSKGGFCPSADLI